MARFDGRDGDTDLHLARDDGADHQNGWEPDDGVSLNAVHQDPWQRS
jgi:hypothetical protein